MRTVRIVVLVVAVSLLGAVPTHGQVTPADKCAAGKMKAAAKKAACELLIDAKGAVKGGTPDYSKCADKFAAAFAKLEARGGCATVGDAASIENSTDAYVADTFSNLANPNSGWEAECHWDSASSSCIGFCGSGGYSCTLYPVATKLCFGGTNNNKPCTVLGNTTECPCGGVCTLTSVEQCLCVGSPPH